jgi:thiamine biosynthesis lipoprotein
MNIAWQLATAVLLTCTACASSPPRAPTSDHDPVVVRLGGEVFATGWNVVVVADDEAAATRGRALGPAVQAAFARVGHAVSAWDAHSDITVFNATSSTSPQPVSPVTAALVTVALDVAERTDGAFDPTLGPLLDVWGLSARTKGSVDAPPSSSSVAAARARTGPVLLHVVGDALQKDRVDVVVDLTAIGDGAAAAAALAVVRDAGFANVLVDVGGEIAACGHGASGPWRVGVDAPVDDTHAGAGAAIALLQGTSTASGCRALSTSGDGRAASRSDRSRAGHILDPRTGAPADHDLVACTIVADDVVVADALSTACMVLGEDGTRAVLPRFAGAEALFVRAPRDDDGALVTTTTTAFPLLR